MLWRNLLIIVIAYLLGSIPSAYIACKVKLNKDIRTLGSGNMGTTNAFRILGPGLGSATFIVDLFKAIIACLIGKHFGGTIGGMLAAFFVVIGHMFPAWLGFRGGKGMACACGILFALLPYHALILVPLFALITLLTGYVSLASLTTAVLAPWLAILIHIPWQYEICIILLALSICYRHRSNWQRIREGTEHQFGFALIKKRVLQRKK